MGDYELRDHWIAFKAHSESLQSLLTIQIIFEVLLFAIQEQHILV